MLGIPLVCDVAYARADNFLREAIYKPDARLWLHRDLAAICLEAARLARTHHNLTLCALDGLRTTDAQQRMMDSAIARANPHWMQDGPNRMLSPTGAGGHPRGMAVDVLLLDNAGQKLDMGTEFDDMTPASARAYRDLPAHVLANRACLEDIMMAAARAKGATLVPLASEWWDFRFEATVYNTYAPLADSDLLPSQRLCS